MKKDKAVIISSDDDSEGKGFNLSAISEFLYLCLDNWKWFLLSIVVCLGIAFLHLGRTAPRYTRSASVHIKEETRNGSISSISDEISNLGLGGTSGSVNNEIVAFNSLELHRKVVRQMNLDINYTIRKGLRRITLFGSDLPVNVMLDDLDDKASLSMDILLLPSGKVLIEEINGTEINAEVGYDSIYSTTVGHIVFSKTIAYDTITEPYPIHITRSPISVATTALHARLQAKQNDAKNSIIDIECEDESAERAEVIITTLIAEYNKGWMKDKNELCVLTSQFIDDRIRVIERELGGVDSDIASYKSSNLITDPIQAASMFMTQANESDQKLLTLTNQVYMCQFLREFIANPDNVQKLIPANIGIQSSAVNDLIASFNQTMLMRNTYLRNSSEKNPMVRNLDDDLNAQRNAILLSLDNECKSLESQISSSRQTIQQSRSVLSESPVKQRHLLTMDRQQKIKEALYLFLLQKREENELSQAFTAYNTRIISCPMGPDAPSSPKSNLIIILSLLMGLIIPLAMIYIRELFYTKVRGRIDLESMSVPYVGNIPEKESNIGKKERMLNRILQRKANKALELCVGPGCHDELNEAFRIVRSNLNFLLHPNVDIRRQVILVTSSVPSSGKTFISLNLASVFAMQDDIRVAIVDLDIRKASLSKFVGKAKVGVTDYLGGFQDDWHELIIQSNNIDILPVGHFPPNPAELLQNKRLEELISAMRQEYDIILLDMPPVEMVADVTIVKHMADITLFVIRTGVMERAMLPSIDEYYKTKYFNNLTLILNSSSSSHGRYGHYGYGRYGYAYGYGNDHKNH
ncbi:MAG: polysaccharide biosynthesis tyrosine autokinase [Paludibacteraceae bacterium]|nr:polysaccharide biosynthesis tyrosine autokinase [Paludibacteraceae bacterium]